MKNNVLDEDTVEAARIYNAFVTSIALPGLFKKEIKQRVINTLKCVLKEDYSEGRGNYAEKKIIKKYVKYLETLI